jgi:DNA processing protein
LWKHKTEYYGRRKVDWHKEKTFMNAFLTLYVLQKVKGIGPRTILKLGRERLGTAETPRQIHELLTEIADGSGRVEAIPVEEVGSLMDEGKRIAEEHDKLSVKTIHCFGSSYPANLRKISSPPIILYCKGNPDSLLQPGIAVIGARNASPYARKVGRRIGELVARHGFTVISGLAAGCDTAGHTGCLNAGGITVAFVGTPLDQTYPPENSRLEEEIIEKNGCIVSEYPVGTPNNPFFFVQRDRLQCGLAESVIVVETGLEGGTWHAIRGCLKLKKPLGCFAYKPEHYSRYPDSLGNKQLLDDGKAMALYDKATMDKFVEASGAAEAVLFS